MTKIQFSVTNIFLIVVMLILLWLIYLTRDVLILVFISIILASAIKPAIEILKTANIRPPFSVGIIFLFFLIFFGLVLWFAIPPLVNQSSDLLIQIPNLLRNSLDRLNIDELFGEQGLSNLIGNLAGSIVNMLNDASLRLIQFGFGIVDIFLQTITVLFLTFYIVLDEDKVKQFIISFFPDKQRANDIFERVESKLGVWVRGQFLVMTIVGVVTYIALVLFGYEYALPLAILAGLFEILPFIGSTIASIPAILIALTDSPTKAVFVALTYFIIQQLEGSIIVPRIMNEEVGLNPIVVIVSVMIGAKLYGPLGALLAIPLAAILVICYEEMQQSK